MIWALGDDPPPEGVQFFRDVVEPIWQSPVADRVKSELKMRHNLYKGRSSAVGSYMFSSFIYCGVCGKVFLAQNRLEVGLMYYRCSTRYGGYGDHECENAGAIRQEYVMDWLSPYIENILAGREIPLTVAPLPDTNRAVQLQTEIDELQIELDRLGQRLATQPDAMLPSINKATAERSQRMGILQSELSVALATSSNDLVQAIDQQTATEDLRKLASVQAFWQQPNHTINQWLHRYFGNWRLKVIDREIVSWVTHPS